jgi:pimeloyl-ACP methyl ester carboxylesterase
VSVTPFTPSLDPYVLDDLRDRLRGARWPDQLEGTGWELGTDTATLRSFVDTWLNDYDWAAQQARFAAFDHVNVDVEAGGERLGVHAVHACSAAEDALPVVLLHGWPSSFVQMLKIIPLLTADGFHVVALSLPGYGFSDRPTRSGMDVARIAGVVVDVMAQLGYDRFAGRGSDLGAGVLQQLALAHPERLVALHLSGTNPYLGWVPDDLSDAEKAFVAAAEVWNQAEMAYAQEHSSKPQTLAHALNDSPIGLASWVLEKFRAWSDCGGDLDAVYDRADLLTNLTIYWGTQTIGSSMRLYYETAHSSTAAWGRVEVPTGMAMSGADMFPTPREWAERSYNVTSWTDLPRGGHFLEWEVPELVADDMRAFFRDHR